MALEVEVDVLGLEADVTTDLVERDAAFESQTTDEPWRDAEPCGNSIDVEELHCPFVHANPGTQSDAARVSV